LLLLQKMWNASKLKFIVLVMSNQNWYMGDFFWCLECWHTRSMCNILTICRASLFVMPLFINCCFTLILFHWMKFFCMSNLLWIIRKLQRLSSKVDPWQCLFKIQNWTWHYCITKIACFTKNIYSHFVQA